MSTVFLYSHYLRYTFAIVFYITTHIVTINAFYKWFQIFCIYTFVTLHQKILCHLYMCWCLHTLFSLYDTFTLIINIPICFFCTTLSPQNVEFVVIFRIKTQKTFIDHFQKVSITFCTKEKKCCVHSVPWRAISRLAKPFDRTKDFQFFNQVPQHFLRLKFKTDLKVWNNF